VEKTRSDSHAELEEDGGDVVAGGGRAMLRRTPISMSLKPAAIRLQYVQFARG